MDDMDAMEVSDDDDNIPERLPKFNFYSYYVKKRSLSRRSNRLLPQQKESLETLRQWFDPDTENKDKIALVAINAHRIGKNRDNFLSPLFSWFYWSNK